MKNLIKAVETEQKNRLNDFINEVNQVETIEKLKTNWRFNDLIPKGKNISSYSIEALKAYLIKRKEKSIYKIIENQVNYINSISEAGELIDVKVSIEWKKSKMWGNNPKAEAWATFINKFGHTDSVYVCSRSIGGCGYDKQSTAVAECLNQIKEVLKPLFAIKNDNIDTKNHSLIGYGSGYGILPNIEGGVGVNCYTTIFNKIGYNFATVASGKNYDVYTITKK